MAKRREVTSKTEDGKNTFLLRRIIKNSKGEPVDAEYEVVGED